MRALVLLLLFPLAAQAGFSCVDPADTTARRWFQDEPCAVGYVHSPLPHVVVIQAEVFPPVIDPRRFTEGGTVVSYRRQHWHGHYRGWRGRR